LKLERKRILVKVKDEVVPVLISHYAVEVQLHALPLYPTGKSPRHPLEFKEVNNNAKL
jgi:hypothetical protein